MKEFKDQEFVIFDVETTGLSPRNGDKVIELAALKVKELAPVDEFHSMINPMRSVSYGAFLVNGISDEMLADAPVFGEILPSFLDFVGDACLIAHNIKFDLGFLNNELKCIGGNKISNAKTLDTLKMARGLLPGLPRYSLLSIAHSLDIADKQEHRAMSDVKITFKVFLKLLEAAYRQDIFDIDLLVDLYGHSRSSRLSGGIT